MRRCSRIGDTVGDALPPFASDTAATVATAAAARRCSGDEVVFGGTTLSRRDTTLPPRATRVGDSADASDELTISPSGAARMSAIVSTKLFRRRAK
jgi:hypothetical protein